MKKLSKFEIQWLKDAIKSKANIKTISNEFGVYENQIKIWIKLYL